MSRPATPPAPRFAFYTYSVIDVSQKPHRLVKVELTRPEARKYVEFNPEADHLRVRRSRTTLYHK